MTSVLAITMLIMAFFGEGMCGRSTRAISIVFAVPPGEQLTAEEEAMWMQAVKDGAAFWEDTYVFAPHFTVNQVRTEAVGYTVYGGLDWSLPYVESDGTILVAIIDDSVSQRLYGDRAVGVTMEEWNAVYIVGIGLGGEDGLASAVAHELGHAVFHLSDILPFWTVQDIMSDPIRAYRDRTIGCQSLAQLGMPCRAFMPMVVR